MYECRKDESYRLTAPNKMKLRLKRLQKFLFTGRLLHECVGAPAFQNLLYLLRPPPPPCCCIVVFFCMPAFPVHMHTSTGRRLDLYIVYM